MTNGGWTLTMARRLAAASLVLVWAAACSAFDRRPSAAGRRLHDLSSVTVVPPKGTSSALKLAEEELRSHLGRVCGSAFAEDAPFRFVFAKPADAPEPQPFTSHYRIDGATVWFWGDDSKDSWLVRHKGTLFAVERFAEKELGLKWYWPGEDGVDCVRRTKVELPVRAEEVFEPKLAKNNIRNYKVYHDDLFKSLMMFTPKPLQGGFDDFRARSFAERELWLGRQCIQMDREGFTYGHAFVKWKDKYFRDHPECFNLNAKTGVRGDTGSAGPQATKRCVSNETNDELILREWCEGGTNEYVNVCENDWTFFCECEKCRALDEPLPGEKPMASTTDRYVHFWNRLCRKARAIRPDVKLVTYAYESYRLAPRREKIDFPDNMVFGFVPSLTDDFRTEFLKWRAAGMRHCFLRPNYHHYYGSIPRGVEKVIYDNFQECLSLGLIGVDYDATYRRDLMDIEYYVTARVVADPSRPFESIVDEFYSAYGAAAPAVRTYFEQVRAAGEAARSRYMKNTADKLEVLDDSQLSILQCYGRTEEELAAELDGLCAARKTCRGQLTDVQQTRFDRLLARAGNALLTFRFLTAQTGDMTEFRKRGEELAAFRVKHAEKMEDCWPFVFGNYFGERRTWRRLMPWTPVDVGVEKPLFRVGIMTDTHIREDPASTNRLGGAYRLFKAQDVSMIVNCGDIAHYYAPQAYANYRAVREATYPDAATAPRELYVWAGHDKNRFPGDAGPAPYSNAFVQVKRLLGIPHEMYDDISFGGFRFLVVPQTADAKRYEAMLGKACAESPGKPVFVFDHPPATGTTEATDHYSVPSRLQLLGKFPQAVVFTGHTHASLHNEQNIWQGPYTTVNAGGLAEWDGGFAGEVLWPMIDSYDVLVMEVFEKKAVIRRYDVRTGKEFGGGKPWTVRWPYDPAHPDYDPVRLRASVTPPAFPAKAELRLVPAEASEPFALRVSFPASTATNTIWCYRLTLARQDKFGTWRTFARQDIPGEYHLAPAERSAVLTYAFNGGFFTPGETCRVTVTPVDFWRQEGTPLRCDWTPPAFSVKTLWQGLPETVVSGQQLAIKPYAEIRLPLPKELSDTVLRPQSGVRVVVDVAAEQGPVTPLTFSLFGNVDNGRYPWYVMTPCGKSDARYAFDVTLPKRAQTYSLAFRNGREGWFEIKNVRIDEVGPVRKEQ